MEKKYIRKAEKSLSAFLEQYGMAAYEETLRQYKMNLDTEEKATAEGLSQKAAAKKRFHPGQEIVLFGYIGMAGTVYLAENHQEQLNQTLPMHFIQSGSQLKERLFILPDPDIALQHGVTAMYQIAEGGLLNGLCHLAAESTVGFRIDYEQVPIKQVTVECCEVFDLNPWQLMSGGCVLMVTEHGYETVRAFADCGQPCQIIGYISDDLDKVICHGEIRSHLNRPQPDELLKVLG